MCDTLGELVDALENRDEAAVALIPAGAPCPAPRAAARGDVALLA